MVKDKLHQVKFSEESHKFRKFLSIILFLGILGGYAFLIGYNAYVSYSASQIRVYPGEFGVTESGSMPNPLNPAETIPTKMIVGGTIFIENDHANSIPISNFNLDLTIYAQDGTKIKNLQFINSTIPAQQNTTLDLTVEFDFLDYAADPWAFADLYTTLSSSEYLIFNLSLSFTYALNDIYLRVELQSDLGGGS